MEKALAPDIQKLSNANFNAQLERKCIFCSEGIRYERDHLVKVPSLQFVEKIISWPTELQDENVMGKCSNLENFTCMSYHKDCYVSFMRKHEAFLRRNSVTRKHQEAYGETINNLVTQIKSAHSLHQADVIVYKLSELANKVNDKLKDMGFGDNYVHKTRLKEQLMSKIDGFRSEVVGREVLLLFEDDVKYILKEYCSRRNEFDDKLLFVEKAASILREENLKDNKFDFDGSLENNFISENTVPTIMIKFLDMVMYGSNENTEHTISSNLAQLVKFNSKKNKRSTTTSATRNVLSREQPLPLYIGLLLHASTHQKHLINIFASLGISISFSRVLEIEAAFTNKICDLYSNDNCVCPPNLALNVFTTAAIDNIDHNPTSNGATYFFHGTGISFIQHPMSVPLHKERLTLTKSDFQQRKTTCLPENYFNVQPLPERNGEIPQVEMEWNTEHSAINAIELLQPWLTSTEGDVEKSTSWATFNSRSLQTDDGKICNSAMLPLLKDNINSLAVIRHTMDISISSMAKINPNQRPVMTGDKPVFARLKTIQWLYPEKYGEDKVVIMLGGLHIEMSFIAVIGTWLSGSGWNEAIVNAGISTPGRTLGLLKGSHVKRCRYAHEVTLTVLNILLRKEYDKDEAKVEGEELVDWIKRKRETSPQYQYWVTTMHNGFRWLK